ncbi:hypothetical protein CDL15_Pgr008638 [Punica granatum]|uniref:Uncharacterized protein n=1 Tax=Punica granatum TaxID=22663 RepID=A0A218XCT0_PUNGR|nr:hypothetical protein CDL15_Pgr008638 [Punica granatum]
MGWNASGLHRPEKQGGPEESSACTGGYEATSSRWHRTSGLPRDSHAWLEVACEGHKPCADPEIEMKPMRWLRIPREENGVSGRFG